MLRRLALLATTACILACTGVSASASYTSVVVLGDSLSDNGNAFNLNTGTPGPGVSLGYLAVSNPFLPPYPIGATKNTNPGGMVAVEAMAASLGLPLLPSTLGGTNFAVSGATTGAANFAYDGFQVPSPVPGNPPVPFYPGLANTGVAAQLGNVLARGPADPGALYVVWAGPNDIFLAGAMGIPPDPAAMIGNILGTVGTLYGAGARKFLVPNMPDLGRVPLFLGTAGAPGASLITGAFNAGLALAIAGMEANSAFAGLDIVPFDTFGLFNEVMANPAAFGFDNVTTPCMLTSLCTDPNKYLFWDEVHPTGAGHAILGARFAAAVPEPAALLLVAVGLLGLAASRRVPGFLAPGLRGRG